jgi:hypothetical protein
MPIRPFSRASVRREKSPVVAPPATVPSKNRREETCTEPLPWSLLSVPDDMSAPAPPALFTCDVLTRRSRFSESYSKFAGSTATYGNAICISFTAVMFPFASHVTLAV